MRHQEYIDKFREMISGIENHIGSISVVECDDGSTLIEYIAADFRLMMSVEQDEKESSFNLIWRDGPVFSGTLWGKLNELI